MLENRTPFLEAFTRTERNSHIDIADLRLLPDPAVKPDIALLHPVTADALIQGLFDGVPADRVGPVRAGRVSCSTDLMRFDFLHDIHIQLHILLRERTLLHPASLIEWHLRRLDTLRPHSAVECS